MPKSKTIGCINLIAAGQDFCEPCSNADLEGFGAGRSLVDQYPHQYKATGDITELDVFAVHQLFQIQDYSGCIQHASRKLLMAGVEQPFHKDIREARDTLTRWLQLQQGMKTE